LLKVFNNILGGSIRKKKLSVKSLQKL